MELIIKNKSQSFEQIVIDLNVYLRSLPDWESWQDYFKTGSGQTVIELIAGLGTQLFYFINIQRQETYLQTAMNRSSVIGIAQMLGYSAGRGNCVKAVLKIIPNATGVYNKFTIIGTCKDSDIIINEDALFMEGQEIEVNVIIGTLKRDHCRVPSSALQPFRMTKPNISEDFILYKTNNSYTENELAAIDENPEYSRSGWVELPTSDKFIDMINDKYVVQTNVLSSVDIFYLNVGSLTHNYQYRQDETIFIDYVELSDTEFQLSDLDFTYGEVLSVESLASYNPVEAIPSIKVNAPLANETQALLRARNDGQKLVQQYGKNYLASVNSRDISAEVVEVTYIKNDFTLLSDLEFEEMYEYISQKCRPMGINMPFITPPVRALLELEIVTKLSNPLVKNSVTESIASRVNSLENVFIVDGIGDQTKLNLESVEEDIETLYGVKIARVYIKAPLYEADKYYRIGQFVSTEERGDFIYKLEDINKFSGETEPNWNTKEGSFTEDGQIQWKALREKEAMGKEWLKNHQYGASQIVLPTEENGMMYQFDNYLGTSGEEEFPMPEEGKTVTYDKELIWFQIARNASAIDWKPNTKYAIGKIVNIEGDPTHSYQMIELRAKSPITDIEWPKEDGASFVLGNMLWKAYACRDERGDYVNPALRYNWNQYLHVDYTLTISE